MWNQISNRLSSLEEEDGDDDGGFVEFNDSWNYFHNASSSSSSSNHQQQSLSMSTHQQPQLNCIDERNASTSRRMKMDVSECSDENVAMYTKSSSGKLRDLSNVICSNSTNDTNSNGKNVGMKCDERRMNDFET